MGVYEQVTYSIIRGYRPLLLDLYLPEGVDRPPIVVWIHGGSFYSGDRRWLHRTFPDNSVFTGLVDAGIACASIDYRLSKEAIWPAQGEDVAAAIEFLRAHADEYGFDAERLGTWGDSAGGHLALMAAFTRKDVAAVVAWYPVTDIVDMDGAGGELPYSPWLGGWPSDMLERCAQASPITHVRPDAPPCLLLHGELDTVVPARQSEHLYTRLAEAGAEVVYRSIPGAEHGFDGHPDVAGLVAESIEYLWAALVSE
ncbi:alpha/beta hydrolase fold domain-containing protein [Nocardia sp. Marseille-Q1738]